MPETCRTRGTRRRGHEVGRCERMARKGLRRQRKEDRRAARIGQSVQRSRHGLHDRGRSIRSTVVNSAEARVVLPT